MGGVTTLPFFLSQTLHSTLLGFALGTADTKSCNKSWLLPLGDREGTAPQSEPPLSPPASQQPETQVCKPTPFSRKPSLPSQDQRRRRKAKYNQCTHHPRPCPTCAHPPGRPGLDSCTGSHRRRPGVAGVARDGRLDSCCFPINVLPTARPAENALHRH